MTPNSISPSFRLFATLPLLVVPWLNPFTSGPNAAVFPFLLTWACTSVALLWWSALEQTLWQRVQTFALAWLLAAGVNAVLGLLQYFGVSQHWGPWVNQPGLGEAFGNLRQRNQFASLCSMGLAALGWWLQRGGANGCRTPSERLLAGALAVVLVAAVAASGSRTGVLQLLVLSVLGWCWSRTATMPSERTMWQILRFASPLLLYLLAAWALPKLAGIEHGALDRWPESSAQCNSRLNLWRNVLYLIAQKPLWGWGWGELGYAHFITLYDAPWAGLRFCELLDNAHNLPLHLAVELGVPVALILCGAVVAWVWRRKPLQEQGPERQLAWAVLAVLAVHSLLEYPLWYAQFQVAALFCVWVLYPFGDAAPNGSAGASRARRWGLPALVVALLIGLACGVAAWSYWRVSQPYLAPEERAPQFREQSWAQMRQVWLFSDQVDFAQLAVTPVTAANAASMQALATDLLHFSPEPMVVNKLLQSAQIQGNASDVAFYALRLQAAYPNDYANRVSQRP